MCGRFTRGVETREIVSRFDIETVAGEIRPSYNVCPGQAVAAIVGGGARRLGLLHWGLPPRGSAGASPGRPVINARAETLAVKPMFKGLLQSRRCLIVADGFFEWRVEGGRKLPVYACMKDRRPFAFAGLWDAADPADARRQPACVVITTAANGLLSPVHHRMPVILEPDAIGPWLDRRLRDPDRLLALLAPYPDKQMDCYAVSDDVNSPRNDTPDLIKPLVQR